MSASLTKLDLYNKALKHLGERKLASLTESREPRRYLDDEYDSALRFCARQGFWNFAMKAQKIDHSSVVTPAFGYLYAVVKPVDVAKVMVISTSETFSPVLRDYRDQGGYWLSNFDPLYILFISNALASDPANFPDDYGEYVGAYLGLQILPRITQKSADEIVAFEKRVAKYLAIARANDAMDQAPAQRPYGTWVTSRSMRAGIQRNIPMSIID